jgi:LytTr DNA-binding domain
MTIADIFSPIALLRRPRLIAAMLPLAVAMALAAVGAFGSYLSMTLPLRLLHFVSISLVIGGLSFVLSESIRRQWFKGALPFWATAAIALVTAPPGGWIVLQALAMWAPRSLPHVSYFELTIQVLMINLLIGSVVWILLRLLDSATSACETPPVSANSDQTLRAKLPVGLRYASILALSAEDHYVRVRTDRGEALILMNLVAAIAALGEDSGVRIHRSHWVSRHLAEGASLRGSRRGIRVGEGAVLPVSRAGRKLLNEAIEADGIGWGASRSASAS